MNSEPPVESFSDFLERYRLPLLFLGLLALVAGARFDATRPTEAEVVAFGLPFVALFRGLESIGDASDALRNAGYAAGAALLVGAEGSVLRALHRVDAPLGLAGAC